MAGCGLLFVGLEGEDALRVGLGGWSCG